MPKTQVTVEYFKTGPNRKHFTKETYESAIEIHNFHLIIDEVRRQHFHMPTMNFTVEAEDRIGWNKVLVITETMPHPVTKMELTKEQKDLLGLFAHVQYDEIGNRTYIVNGLQIREL